MDIPQGGAALSIPSSNRPPVVWDVFKVVSVADKGISVVAFIALVALVALVVGWYSTAVL